MPRRLVPVLRREAPALLAVLALAAVSWWLIHAAAVARQRPFNDLGEPPLLPLGGAEGAPSQIGPYAWMWSEAAFHYRTALIFAVDDYQPPDLLHDDTWQQHPEGVDAWRTYALMMEPVYGHLYRLLAPPGQTFAVFLLVLVPLAHVLTFLPLYALGRVVGAPRRFALAGLLVYAGCTLGFGALLESLLLKETFSLLLLAVFLALQTAALARPTPARLAGAGAALALLLPSWHLAQFLAAVVIAAGAAAAAAGPPQPRAWRLPLVYALAGAVAGLTPALAGRGFTVSLPMAPVWGWLVWALVVGRAGRFGAQAGRRLAVLAVCVAGAAGLALLNRGHTADYDHVFGLLRERLAHGFRKPVDPAELPFAVRLFWAAPFTSPSPATVWLKTGLASIPIAAAAAWAAWAGWRRGTPPATRALALAGVGFALLWLLSERLGVVFLLAVPALLASGASGATGVAGRRRSALLLAVLVAIPAANLGVNLRGVVRTAVAEARGRAPAVGGLDLAEDRSRAALFAWITAHTLGPGQDQPGAAAVFAGDIALSPQILLYAGRPVVLNSQFENTTIRDRYEAWLQALFSADERDLMALAARLRIDYVVVHRDLFTASGRWSARYAAGWAGPPALDSVAALIHFSPSSLRGLMPVYDNDHYRVLRVRVRRDETAPAWDRGYGSWWEPANWQVADRRLAAGGADRARLQAAGLRLADLRAALERLAAAVAPAWQPDAPGDPSRLPLLELQRQAAEPDVLTAFGGAMPGVAAALEPEIAARLAETGPDGGQTVGGALAAILDGDPAGGPGLLGLDAGLVLHPDDSVLAGNVAVLAGRRAAAAGCFARAAARLAAHEPQRAELWRDAVWWLLAAGRKTDAVRLADQADGRIPPGSQAAGFLAQVAALPIASP